MADRKKVQKIRTKRTVKFKSPGDVNLKKSKNIEKEISEIKMDSEKTAKNTSAIRNVAPNKNNTSNFRRKSSNSTDQIQTRQRNNLQKKIPSFSVIRGKKGEIKKKRIVTYCVSLILIVSVLIFCFTSPTGPIERITNAFALMGDGEYPAVLSGTKVLSLQSASDKYFALTNTHLCGYNYSGKNFLLLQHNFSNPVLDIAEERVLIYNRESNKFIIANNSEALFEENLSQPIYSADISYNGSVAFVCDSASYSAEIKVFDKNMEQYYTWYLADGLVSDIAISNDGQYVALAVLKVSNGAFLSQIYCLDTERKEPIYIKELPNETVYKLESVSSSNFIYSSDKNLAFAKWESGQITNKNNFGAPSYYNKTSSYHLALYGEAGRSNIVLFDSSGKVKHEFEYNGIIDDISVSDGKVYVLSGNKVVYFNFSRKKENNITLDSKPEYILGVEGGFLSFKNINISLVSAK